MFSTHVFQMNLNFNRHTGDFLKSKYLSFLNLKFWKSVQKEREVLQQENLAFKSISILKTKRNRF